MDIIVSTMTINAEREKEIDFSVVYYLAGQSLLAPQNNSAITGVKDLAGKKVGTAKGSTSEKNIRTAAPQADVRLFDGYSEAVAAMAAGQLDAVTTDDNILIGFQSKEPNKWKLVGGQFTKEPYGIGVAQGHPELVEVVTKVIRDQSRRQVERNLPKEHSRRAARSADRRLAQDRRPVKKATHPQGASLFSWNV